MSSVWIPVGLLLVVYAHAICEGIREGLFYDRLCIFKRKDLPWKGDEHELFSVQRFVFFLPVLALTYYTGSGFWPSTFIVLGLAGIWYVVHEGAYYLTRHKLNPRIYKAGFWADNVEEEEETSDFDKSGKFRMVILCFAFLAWLGGLILNL